VVCHREAFPEGSIHVAKYGNLGGDRMPAFVFPCPGNTVSGILAEAGGAARGVLIVGERRACTSSIVGGLITQRRFPTFLSAALFLEFSVALQSGPRFDFDPLRHTVEETGSGDVFRSRALGRPCGCGEHLRLVSIGRWPGAGVAASPLRRWLAVCFSDGLRVVPGIGCERCWPFETSRACLASRFPEPRRKLFLPAPYRMFVVRGRAFRPVIATQW